jgi:amino-acid N-acetyltransferase
VNDSVSLRAAAPADAPAIHRLIMDNIEVGHLLPRSLDDVRRHVSRFVVAVVSSKNDAVVGCAELAPLSASVAEVRSLVVDAGFRGRRIGPRLVAEVASSATAGGYSALCAFSHEPAHFVRMGFTIVPHIWVPEKIAHDCTSCSLFRRCGQHAVTLPLRAGISVGPERPAAVIHGSRSSGTRRLPLRPVTVEEEVTEAVPA